jgi:hypothetical protein
MKPSSRAASSNPNNMLAGPNNVGLHATTPNVNVRRVTKARADEFRRYPSSSIARSTSDRVESRTLG